MHATRFENDRRCGVDDGYGTCSRQWWRPRSEWWQGGDALKGAKTQRVSEAKTERNLDFLFYSRLYSEPRREEDES
jgi:hypothetical protein